ncbi:nitroreductase [Loktanella salsilacus]|uniref:nitroreductase family protein n=1 Tax=Loktanella salsilacus TaxID=195913 RepID=UPI0020B8DB1C|nr:nitroreductase [Loktanella salsilacus]UTH47360.1 nitroreductase [Loktanella salsilacus]
MSQTNQAALDFMLTRRSYPAQALNAPVPDRDQLHTILTAASRSPDHGKLEPWRFIVLGRDALQAIADALPAEGKRIGIPQDKIDKPVMTYSGAQLAVVVVCSPKDSEKVPQTEQVYAVGGVCLGLVNAALASGFGATWLSGWFSHNRDFIRDHFNLADHETVAGIVHIGTCANTPSDRPRPDIDAITDWSAL